MRAFKKELTMFAVMIALAIITAVLNPLFLGGDNLRNNIRHISLISLFALGEAMVIIAGGIDLSIGSIICVTAVSTSYLAMYGGVGIGAAVAISLVAALVVGIAQGTIIARFKIPPFVVTMGSMLLLRGVAEVLTGGSDVGFQGKYPGFRKLGEGIALGLPVPCCPASPACSTSRTCRPPRRRWATRSSCTPSRRPCWAAARSRAARARCSAC